MKTTYLLLAGLFIISFTQIGFSQQDFQAGFIIKKTNDTIFGFINLKSNYSFSKMCEFKQHTDSPTEIYTVEGIKSFRIENQKYYIAKEVTIDSVKRKIFLEFLVEGIVNLYYYRDKVDEFYFIEKDNAIYPLSNKDLEVIRTSGNPYENPDKKYSLKSNQYKGILTVLFQASPEVQNKIRFTPFDYKALINITKDYHNAVCKDQKCIDYTKVTSHSLTIEPNIGIVSSTLRLKSSSNSTKDLQLTFGFNLRFTPRKINYHWNYLIGFSYSTNSFKPTDFENQIFTKNTLTYQIRMNYTILKIPLMVEYSFPAKKIQPFVSIAYENIFILNPVYEVREYGGLLDSKFRRYQYGFLGGAGIRYKINDKSYIQLKTDFELRLPFQNTREILDFHSVRSMAVIIGYGFKI